MKRLSLLMLSAVFLAGCQVQDPFAVFGPPRVPAPTTAQSAPYYPPTASAPKQPTAIAPAISPRISVSAEDKPSPLNSGSRFAAESTDREPIRIVENPSPTRTASASSRSQTPTPGAIPMQLPAQPAGPPKLPPGGKLTSPQSGVFKTDPAVAPATFIESAPASGQWRAR